LTNAQPSETASLDLNQLLMLRRSKAAQRGSHFAQDHSAMNSSLQLRRTLVWELIICLLLSVVLPVTCPALEIQRVQTCSGIVLRLRGDIKEGDFSRLKSHFGGRQAIVGFDLSSNGGILEEGLRIANFTRRKKLTVYIADECNSVCADVFFAAARRYFGVDSKIGVHAVSNDRDIEDVGSKLLTIKLARLWADQGIPNSAIGKMVTTRPETITYLDPNDLSGLDASAGNPFAYNADKPIEAAQIQQQGCATQSHVGGGGIRRVSPRVSAR
jgi:hypothetical protein